MRMGDEDKRGFVWVGSIIVLVTAGVYSLTGDR